MFVNQKSCPRISYRPLITLLEEIQKWFHGPQNWENRGIIMTSGAQEGLSKAVDMCMKCGDPVIMPDPVYTGAIDLVNLIFLYHKTKLIFTLYYHSKVFVRKPAVSNR